MRKMRSIAAAGFAFCSLFYASAADDGGAIKPKENYDEAKAGNHPLPKLFEPGTTALDWMNRRRAEVLKLFEKTMYGEIPGRPDILEFKVVSEKKDAVGGLATRKEIDIVCAMNDGRKVVVPALLYLPNGATKPVAAFAALNFMGNHGDSSEDDVRIAGFASIFKRHGNARRLPLELLMKNNFAVITACYSDFYPDRLGLEGAEKSIYSLFFDKPAFADKKRVFPAISAWSWGFSRLLDCLENEPRVNAAQVGVVGHSRQGKASLWAGAADSRFAWVISNDSGCGGAAIARRDFGETVEIITERFPHWFVPAYRTYMGRETELPVDQHMLLALAAPRPVYVASASEDLWADPKGEFLSLKAAGEVYRLFGAPGLTCDWPGVEQPVSAPGNGYHLRNGKHDLLEYDWKQYIRFVDENIKREK